MDLTEFYFVLFLLLLIFDICEDFITGHNTKSVLEL